MQRAILLAVAATMVAVGAARAAGDAARGEKVFEECASCHSVEQGANKVGPSLHGIIGRKAGSIEDFRYSPAMKKSDITWSAQTLDKFIADTQMVVPGNRMPFAGVPDAGERTDLIAYLEMATK